MERNIDWMKRDIFYVVAQIKLIFFWALGPVGRDVYVGNHCLNETNRSSKSLVQTASLDAPLLRMLDKYVQW